jgi:hypothetical protein
VEKRPGVDRRSSGRPGLGLSGTGRALAAGPNATQVAPSGVHRSKGTDAAEASSRATGSTPDPDRTGSLLSRWHSPHGIEARQLVEGLRNGWRHHLGDGADETSSVRTAMLSVLGFGRGSQWRVRRSPLGVSENTVLRHGAPGWQQQAEAVGSCSAEAAWSTGSGLVRSEVYRLYPRYAAAEWILWMKPGRGLWHLGAQRRQRCRPSGQRRGQQHRLDGEVSAESASRTTLAGRVSARPAGWGTTTAGGQRPQ